MTMRPLTIGRSWPLIKVRNEQKDREIDRAIFGAEPVIVCTLLVSGMLDNQPWSRIVAMLSLGWCAPGTLNDRYSTKVLKKHRCLSIQLNANLLALRRMTYEQMVDDIARSFLIALRDVFKRRRVSVARLDEEITKLGPPKTSKTAFLNLLGDINPKREGAELSGSELVLSLPLPTKGVPTEHDFEYVEQMETLLARRLKQAGVVVGHEAGSGSVEFFVTCDKHSHVVEALRQMVSVGELPAAATVLARNLKTDTERVVSLKSRNR